jgi:hypothetical protein
VCQKEVQKEYDQKFIDSSMRTFIQKGEMFKTLENIPTKANTRNSLFLKDALFITLLEQNTGIVLRR